MVHQCLGPILFFYTQVYGYSSGRMGGEVRGVGKDRPKLLMLVSLSSLRRSWLDPWPLADGTAIAAVAFPPLGSSCPFRKLDWVFAPVGVLVPEPKPAAV